MLAELLQLSRNLKLQGVPVGLVHRDYRPPGRYPSEIRALISLDGTVSDLDSLSPDDMGGLWTLVALERKRKFFPAIRPPKPLITLDLEDTRWSALKEPSSDFLLSLIDEQRGHFADCVLQCDGQADRILQWPEEDNVSLARLQGFARAFKEFSRTPSRTTELLINAIRDRLGRPSSVKLRQALGTLLVGTRKEAKGKKAQVEYKVQVLLDLKAPDDLGFTIYHPRIQRIVLEQLIAEDGIDSVLKEPFPAWSRPPLISMPIAPFSKFSDARCNFRYGKADEQGFVVTTSTAQQLVAALKTVTSDEFLGKTWHPLHTGMIEQKKNRKVKACDILIAYPSWDIQTLSTVDIIASPKLNTTPKEKIRAAKRFGEMAEPLLTSMKQRQTSSSIPDYLTILLIRQISNGQIQLAYSAQSTLSDSITAIEAWNESEDNLPPQLRVPLPVGESRNEYRLLKPRLLFPEDISYLLSRQWIRDGSECTLLHGPAIGVVLDLFLRRSGVWRQCAEDLLEMTLARAAPLLIAAGNVLHRDGAPNWGHWRAFGPGGASKGKRDPRYDTASVLSLLGTLLFALNSDRRRYMNEKAFLVGKLLTMADELHRCYCIVVRDGDIPPSLLGNGLVSRASDSPASALADLLDRSRIYIGWAKTAPTPSRKPKENDDDYKQRKEAVNSAREVLRYMQPLADDLRREDSLKQELTTEEKAHLLLGYLSPVLARDTPNQESSKNRTAS